MWFGNAWASNAIPPLIIGLPIEDPWIFAYSLEPPLVTWEPELILKSSTVKQYSLLFPHALPFLVKSDVLALFNEEPV